MTEITTARLKSIMPNIVRNIAANRNFAGTEVSKITELLNVYAKKFEIDTPLRWAHYLAQIAHESGEMRYSEEIASGEAYEGRKNLGNTQKGDGVKYKGRGLIQLTGRANYTAYKAFCGYDVLEKPELLSQPIGAIRSSMWFWWKNGLNALADKDNVKAITKKINGGTNGMSSRLKYLEMAKTCFRI